MEKKSIKILLKNLDAAESRLVPYLAKELFRPGKTCDEKISSKYNRGLLMDIRERRRKIYRTTFVN